MATDRRALQELGRFLRVRRASVDPAARGLPVGNRRAPGLRREEVAILASISPSWYTYLEQGRDIRPSASVINALADVLDLDAGERRYVNLLAFGGARHRDQPPTEEALAAAELLVRAVDPLPAFAGLPTGDVFAWNDACSEWMVDFGALPENERNSMIWVARHPDARERLPDWEFEVRDYFGRFRAAMPSQQDNPRVQEVVAMIESAPADVRAIWDLHEIRELKFRTRRLRHPVHGVREYLNYILLLGGADAVGVIIHVPLAPSDGPTIAL